MCLTVAFLESNRPVRAIVANGGWYEEALGELGVDYNLHTAIEFTDEFTFVLGVGEDVLVDVPVNGHGFAEVCFRLLAGEDVAVVSFVNYVVGQVLHDDGCFLLVDQTCGLGNKVFGVTL